MGAPERGAVAVALDFTSFLSNVNKSSLGGLAPEVLEVMMSNFVMLLVEDDAVQRVLLAEMLRDENFEVIECATAEAAELVVTSTGNELQALVTDNNLAGNMSGKELAGF